MVKRADLLALTVDDLMVLSNRGLVKRAQKELAAGMLTYEMADVEGALRVEWSDGVVCELPENEVVCDRHCTCNATTLCRHLIRSVLAYQASFSEPAALSARLSPSSLQTTQVKVSENPQPPSIWNPGDISDADLSSHFRTVQLNKLKEEFATGQVIEVTCSHKPTAQLHSFPHALRFLVPHDFRYTYCDCDYESPCPHVPLAIWAFRQLPKNQSGGIISTEQTLPSVPVDVLDDIESVLPKLVSAGLQGLSPGLMASLEQLRERCEQAYLIWPANILEDLMATLNLYRSRDAGFAPQQITDLLVELCIRCDAIRSHTNVSPQLFLRGPRSQKLTDLGSTRLIGLGCRVRIQHQRFCLITYLQDTNSGKVLAVQSKFNPLPDSDISDNSFWQAAMTNALKQTSWAALGSGQLLIKRAACTADNRLQLKRNQPVVANPQRFEWEKLRAPVLADDFTELQQRLQTLPPKALRPRHITEGFYVLAVSRVEEVSFSAVEQATTATVYDVYNNAINLFFPYTHQAREGTEALLAHLSNSRILFISGQVSIQLGEMVIVPIAIIWEQEGRRYSLQPWICPAVPDPETVSARPFKEQIGQNVCAENLVRDPVQHYLQRLFEAMSALVVSGLASIPQHTENLLQALASDGKALGFQQLALQLSCLSARPEDVTTQTLAQKYLECLVLAEAVQLLINTLPRDRH